MAKLYVTEFAESDINSASIGIEIQNPGHEMGYPEFPEPPRLLLTER